jgi:large subunit ribosomal protein L17
MRHRKRTIKLGRTTAHRESMLAGMVCDLIHEKRITTTVSKAKAARSLAERMVTLGKRGGLGARRRAITQLRQPDRVKELFDSIAPTFEGRSGGYTRILRVGRRRSDGSEMVILEWVEQTAGGPARTVAAKEPEAAEPVEAAEVETPADQPEESAETEAEEEEAVTAEEAQAEPEPEKSEASPPKPDKQPRKKRMWGRKRKDD